jgi:hypothetical protein
MKHHAALKLSETASWQGVIAKRQISWVISHSKLLAQPQQLVPIHHLILMPLSLPTGILA